MQILIFTTIFQGTVLYIATSDRIKSQSLWLMLQGLLLFIIAMFTVEQAAPAPMHIFILAFETIVLRSIFIPVMIQMIQKKNKMDRISMGSIKNVHSTIIISAIMILSFWFGNQIHNTHIMASLWMTALSTFIAGLYIILIHRNILMQIIGYIMIENSVFLLTLGVGTEMPMLVTGGVILDLLATGLALGIFFNRIGSTFDSTDDSLNKLKV